MTAVVVCSGGLDSVTLAHLMAAEGKALVLVTFDYGQRHKKEIGYAKAAARRLGAEHKLVDFRELGELLCGSALTGDRDVPEGHYAEANMEVTVVPNRNTIMLSIAYGLAASAGAEVVAAAFHGGDHFIYPDCRPGFADAFDKMQRLALEGFAEVSLHTPFIHWSKAEIAAEGARLNVPFEETWSCYKGDDLHCGRCGTCVERREAFHLAGIGDPTLYSDPDFWKAAVAAHTSRQEAR
ncbi:MAG: 7-cyano-7-deazaguanine synthase QueC [Kiloniellales bacterium]|nr:7-cyano-7-deazaguanine synthase QueC [Kiloniellales bacterium]